MLAAESQIILHKIQTGRLTDEEMDQLVKKGADKLMKAKVFFDESSSVNIRSLKAKARRLKKKNNLGLIVIDYLQLMNGENSKGNREQEISAISRELKNLAQELDVPVIALSQLSREGVKGCTWEVGPPVSALRESGAIEQDADLILMLWGPNESELANDASLDGKRKLRIAKQRNGVLVTVELDFRSEIQLFDSIKTYF
jgi:replicative DNA helicase